jgi:hypothetical protein
MYHHDFRGLLLQWVSNYYIDSLKKIEGHLGANLSWVYPILNPTIPVLAHFSKFKNLKPTLKIESVSMYTLHTSLC